MSTRSVRDQLRSAGGGSLSVSRRLRQLDDRIGQAGLTYRAAAVGHDASMRRLAYVESVLAEDCKTLARAVAAEGGERRLMGLLRQRRKLASLLANGDFELLKRYVSFINGIMNSVRPTAVDI